MSRIFVAGLHPDRKAILEELHQKETVEVCKPETSETDEVYFKETAKSIEMFDKYMQSAESSLAILDSYAPEKSGFFSGRRVVPVRENYAAAPGNDDTLRSVYRIVNLSEKIREHNENIRQINIKQAALEPYLSLDIPINTHETSHTFIKIGTLNGTWNSEQLRKELENHELYPDYPVHFEILNASKQYTYIWFAFLKTHEQQINAFLHKINFTDAVYNISHHTPARKTELLEEEKSALEKEIQDYISEIKELNKSRRDIELFYDRLSLRKDKYQTLAKIGMTEHAFMLEGYIPEKYGENIRETLESKYCAYVELTEPGPEEDVPVMFKNNIVFSPVEGITEAYSMPSPADIDPNPIVAFFYYLFFGMMFSDAGYGLLLVIVCGYLGFSKRLDKHKRGNYRMFFFCGVSTVFWGLMYGSFFGDIIYTISLNFFGSEVNLAPIWINPIANALDLMIFSVALGMIQIMVGLAIKFYTMCRQKQVLDAVFDVGFWMIALSGIALLAAGVGLGVPVLTTVGTWLALSAAAGLILTGGRNNKNLFTKIFGGIIGLYNITGYVSDALSYCRLMALGLATGSIANVVNMLSAMLGKSVIGVLLFIIIAVFGHSLNFAMNMLGSYVHTNRLQYVEFFSKFYDGGGKKFEPFRMNTKYCEFSEE